MGSDSDPPPTHRSAGSTDRTLTLTDPAHTFLGVTHLALSPVRSLAGAPPEPYPGIIMQGARPLITIRADLSFVAARPVPPLPSPPLPFPSL